MGAKRGRGLRKGSIGVEIRWPALAAVCLGIFFLHVPLPAAAQSGLAQAESPGLPDAPPPQNLVRSATPAAPCPAKGAAGPPSNAGTASTTAGRSDKSDALAYTNQSSVPCKPPFTTNWFSRFLTGPEVKPLTPQEKARLAVRNVIDPFNALTILGDAAISVGANSHSQYGPGMEGFGKYVGVSYTQDITGEFFSTFLIPSLVHQDPHYHRMPNATIPRRIRHAITQIVWTQGDNGKGMLNYADIVGAAVQDGINNLYVPGRETNLEASASRYGIGLATAPIDNFVSEFLPDVARHIHVQVVVIQRIINHVASSDGSGQS